MSAAARGGFDILGAVPGESDDLRLIGDAEADVKAILSPAV
jgi:hypothetical protein